MDEAAWQELVRRLEPKARSHPRAYRWRVAAFAALGYALVGGVVVVLVALVVGIAVVARHQPMGAIRFVIPILALLGAVLQAFYVKVEPPDGRVLTPADAPDLFDMIEEIRRAVRGPRVHDVLLDGDLNAGIVQNPRAGGLLGSRNYLVIGLPCFAALSADEFRAVVAHEFGHLSRRHGRFGTFVYRVYMRWMQLLESLEERKSTWARPARRFARWYTPTFEAYALPLIRAHELEADDAAAAASGRPAAATALVSLGMASRWLDTSYWPTLYERVIDDPEPPRTAFAPMTREIAKARQAPDLELWYHDLLAVETGAADTHPSLAERLAHLEMDPQTALELAMRNGKASAASRYLGGAEDRLVAEHDRTWRQAVTPEWHTRHAEAQSDRAELEQLDARDSLSAEEELHRAQLTETFRGPEPALDRYRELLGGENDPHARFAVGRLLLAADDEEGLQWLEEAMAGNHDAVLPGCDLAWSYLHTHGRDDEAGPYVERWEAHAKLVEAARIERATLSVDDRLEPPDIPLELLQQLGNVLLRHKRVAGAYLVRKRVELFDDTDPLHVLGIVPITDGRAAMTDADADALAEHIVHEIEKITSTVEFVIFVLERNSPLAQRLAQVDRACLYDSTRDAPSPR